MNRILTLTGLAIALLTATPLQADSWSSPEYFAVISDVTWNPATSQVEVKARKNASGAIYLFKYNWTISGQTQEHARFLMSMLTTAQATGRRVDIFGDHNGAGIWGNFSGVSLVD